MRRALLRAASWLVPRDGRPAWLAEWRAELWHVARVERAQSLPFCLGAFRDAFWLRRHDQSPRMPLLGTPARCLGVLAVMACLAFSLRPVERIPADVVAIREHSGRRTLTFDRYRAITGNLPAAFVAVGFYRPMRGGPALATAGIADVLRGAPLPGGVTRFVIVDDPGPGAGYVLARAPNHPRSAHWHIRASGSDGRLLLLDCELVAPPKPFVPMAMLLAGALIVVAATTTLPSGLSRRAWAFLTVKMVLASTAAVFGFQLLPSPIMPQSLIVGLAVTIRWALNDQRRRCPVCLRLVTNPVSFGCLSHTLLDWHGSEFVCPEGHGLLHVSATFASPYAAQQWVRL